MDLTIVVPDVFCRLKDGYGFGAYRDALSRDYRAFVPAIDGWELFNSLDESTI
jgi:hypothetical protein